MKKIVISGIKMPIQHTTEEVFAKALKLARRNGIDAVNPVIYKKSLDARKKSDIHFVYSILFETEKKEIISTGLQLKAFEDPDFIDFTKFNMPKSNQKKAVVVGSGPCGLFAAYILSACGINTVLLERGSDVDTRQKKVERFWKTGILDPDTNIQFGEGGAGTFSDGKLNTRIGSPLQHFVLKTFTECGAPEEIMYQAKPHIGTDLLRGCVKNLREKIITLGGNVLFNACVTDIVAENGRVTGVRLTGGDYIECDALVLAIGHSSRDTYEMLARRGVALEQKPFAAGVRVEHSREFINRVQYGDCYDVEKLPTADYRLAYNGETRSCYSFCMCPGGTVVNASSEDGLLCINGMSEHARMADNSNSALVVTVKPEDFKNESPLAGVEFQRTYERMAYELLGGKGPVQLVRDFVKNRVSDTFDGVKPSFTGETGFADLRGCLPSFITDTLCEGFVDFEKKIKGFSDGGAVLTGVEMRTSSPLRIKRDENFESISHQGLFPAGEGAGYAGGIMSAAVDGIRVAQRILEMW